MIFIFYILPTDKCTNLSPPEFFSLQQRKCQAVKKGVALCKKARVKKGCEIQVVAKDWL